MAFFKFRQSGENPTPPTHPAESVEVMRQRAKHRLIGAVVLVLLGVIGFPLLFDTQPRPIPVDIQIDMPDKNKVAPLQIPVVPAPVASSVTFPTAKLVPAKPAAGVMANVSAAASLDPEEQLVVSEAAKNLRKPAVATAANGMVGEAPQSLAQKSESKSEPKPTPKAESKVDLKADLKSDPKNSEAKPPVPTDVKPDAKGDDGARAKLLLEGKDPAKAVVEDSRYIIQVGAFADPVKAREVRLKLEKAGFKTYTHVAETKEGQRIRVRVGPFGSKAEADKVAGKVKTLSLPAAILTL